MSNQKPKGPLLEKGINFTRNTKSKTNKAIYTIREVFQDDIYETKGMACAVDVRGSVGLLTWSGVFGADSTSKSIAESIVMDRFSKTFPEDLENCRLSNGTIKENGRFSFITVNGVDPTSIKLTSLDLLPRNDIKTSDFIAYSFYGKEVLELNFKYDENQKKHKLDTGEGKKRIKFLEKSSIIGAPIMVDQDNRKVVVGVVGVSGGELSPYFITEKDIKELDLHVSKEEKAKDKSKLVTDLSKEEIQAKDKSKLVTGQRRNLNEGLKDGPSSSGTDEPDAIGVKTGDIINDETKQNAMGVGLTSQLHRDNLMRNLSSRNLVVDEVKGDGNCFFRAVARQLCKHMTRYKETVGEHCTSLGLGRCEEEDTRQLRQLFVMELQGNIDEYKKWMTSGSDMLKEIGKFEVNGYFESVVGDLCVTATAKLLRIPIVLVTARQTPPTMEFVPQDLATTPPIVLAYDHSGPGHYDATNEIQSSDKNIEKVIPADTRYTCGQGRNLNGNSSQDSLSSSGTEETDVKFGSAIEFSEKVRSGAIPLTYLPYLALDIVADGDWRSIGGSLGLSQGDLNCIKSDNDERYERCYKILTAWHQSGNASYKVLADVLQHHSLDAIRENYCLEEHEPPTEKTVPLRNLKPGRVNSNDLRSIADAVKGKRQRLGRALVLKDNDVEQIVNQHRGNIYEQSYQILRKWWQGGSKATYSALAQALHDRTVNMGLVATTFCLEKTGF